MTGGFGKDERRFSIGIRKETYAKLERLADDEEMVVGTYVSWQMEQLVRGLEERGELPPETEEED